MALPRSLERFAHMFRDVARRAERVAPLGETTAQRASIAPTELIGIEDSVIVRIIPAGGSLETVPYGHMRVGEFVTTS